MLKKPLILTVFLLLAAFSYAAPDEARAFQGAGCMGDCKDCHTLSNEEAVKLLKTEKFSAKINDIKISPVKGLWQVELTQNDKPVIIYVDFSKKYLVQAQFTKLDELGEPAPLKKVDVKKIPLDGALVYGSAKAEKKIIVFSDPDCPYCKKLHEDIKGIVSKRKDIAFYIKLFPLQMHPEAYAKSKTVICKKSTKLLDDAMAGKTLPKPDCKAEEVDNNLKLGEELGIRGTPAIIFPDGRLLPGYLPPDALLELLEKKE
ncbi:MAG: DsbC family protein [Deltaproteobacteria bacterium]